MHRKIAKLAVVIGFEAGALVLLLYLGRRPWLNIQWSELRAWLRVTPPEDAIAALIWLAALGCVIWLSGSTLLYLVARASQVPALINSVEWMTLPVIRRVTEGALAAILATSSMTVAPAWADPPPPVVVVVDPDGALLPPGLTGPAPEGQQEAGWEPGVPPLPPLPHEIRADVDESPSNSVVVRNGDNLWTMSRRHLTAALGRRPANQEIAPFWRQVIAHNQPHLISGNPDLIYAGETIEMPPTG